MIADSLENITKILSEEIGDIRPGPERDKKFAEVVRKHLAQAQSSKERIFWNAMLSTIK
jgi:hypothetical protein